MWAMVVGDQLLEVKQVIFRKLCLADGLEGIYINDGKVNRPPQ